MVDPEGAEPEGTFGQFVGCIGLLVGLAALIAGVVWLVGKFVSDESKLARIELSPSPAQAAFKLEKETTVQVWADLDVNHRGFSAMSDSAALPHVLDYVVELNGEHGVHASLRCNPFNSHIARTSGSRSSIGSPAGRYYDGLLDRCAVRLPAGAYTIRAHREAVGAPDGRITFLKTALVLRTE